MDMKVSKVGLLSIGGAVVAILIAGGAYLYYRAIKKY